jgi:hypothetical protein
VRPVALSNVRKVLFVVAVQAQSVCVVTVTLPAAASAETLALVGLMVNVQGGGAAACDTLNALPATVAVPIRVLVVVLAATE